MCAVSFTIEGRLDGLNEYTNACRSHRNSGSRMKKRNQEAVMWAIKAARLKPLEGPVYLRYTFYERPNPKNGKMRDRSNISAFAVKVIEDALQECGIIEGDGFDQVIGDSRQYFRSKNPRIVVEIERA